MEDYISNIFSNNSERKAELIFSATGKSEQNTDKVTLVAPIYSTGYRVERSAVGSDKKAVEYRFSADADPEKSSGNIQEARRCYERAHALRTKKDENAVDPEALKIKEFLINPDISPERLGLKKQNLKELWSSTAAFIKKLELEDEDKNRIMRESAEVMDVDYEDVTDRH
jgi:hypothetical protein